jgi:hypothetical protein
MPFGFDPAVSNQESSFSLFLHSKFMSMPNAWYHANHHQKSRYAKTRQQPQMPILNTR